MKHWGAWQQRRRQVRKRHLKNEIALPQTLSRLFYLVQIRQMLANLFGIEF